MNGVHAGIDSATDWLCLALWSADHNRLLGSRELLAERQHASLLLPTLQELLAEHGLTVSDLSAVGIGTGPGSYTGLRVGLASAQGLADGLGVPLGGTPSLEAAAWRQLQPGQEAWLAWDARRGNVYAARYLRSENGVSETAAPGRFDEQELSERAAAAGTDLLRAGAPDAGWIAHRAAHGGSAEPLYF